MNKVSRGPRQQTFDLLDDLKKNRPDFNIAEQVLNDIAQVDDPAVRAELHLKFMQFIYPTRRATDGNPQTNNYLHVELRPDQIQSVLAADVFGKAIEAKPVEPQDPPTQDPFDR